MSDAHLIIAGQSNVGYNTDTADLTGYVPTARVQIWDVADGQWEYLHPGFNASGLPTQPAASGFMVVEAEKWLAANPTGYLWIVQVAHGSTGLAEDPAALDWSPHSVGEMYAQLVSTVNTAQHNLDGSPYAFAHWDAFEWMQGETDATNAASADAYAANLSELIADVRHDMAVSNIIIGRITDTAGAYSLEVRQAEWAEGQEPGVTSFKTIGDEMQPGGIHYDSVGQVQLGGQFYDAWAAL